jgi:glycosyltransferase involved in cell wall biosynthesis
MISVITPVFNGENYIAETIESVIAQTYTDWEYIIVDDGSTDGTPSLVKKYLNDDRIKYIRKANSGCSSARNRGIENAKGEYIAVLDADDVFYPQKLEMQLEYMEKNPACVALGTNADVVDAMGNIIFTSRQPDSNEEIKSKLPASPFFNSSILFRRIIFGKYEYDERLKCGAEDGYLTNQIAGEGEFMNMNKALIKYRIHPNSKGRRTRKCGDIILAEFAKLKTKQTLDDYEIERLNKISEKLKSSYKNEYNSYLCYLYFTYNEKIKRQKFSTYIFNSIKNYPFNLYNYYYLFLYLLPANMLKRYYNKEWL